MGVDMATKTLMHHRLWCDTCHAVLTVGGQSCWPHVPLMVQMALMAGWQVVQEQWELHAVCPTCQQAAHAMGSEGM